MNELEPEFQLHTETQLQTQIHPEFQTEFQKHIQKEQRFQEEWNFNQELLEDQYEELEKIRYDSKLINEMVKDLAEMVTKQNNSIDDITNGTKTAKNKSKKALIELKKTARNQEESELCSLCSIV